MRLFGSDGKMAALARLGLDEDTPISAGLLSGAIERAQKSIEGNNFARRKNVLDYDDVMNQQRKLIYAQRAEVLAGEDMHAKILKMIEDSVASTVGAFTTPDEPISDEQLDALRSHYIGWLFSDTDEEFSREALSSMRSGELTEVLLAHAMEILEEKEALFGAEPFREVERVILLRNVDTHWMDHLDAMDDLKEAIGLNGYAQRNPVVEYRIQGAQIFEEMVDGIREATVRAMMTVVPREKATERVEVAKATGTSGGSDTPVKKKPAKTTKTVGRNDPCPCGSGKKFKVCCGANPNAVRK